MASSSGYWGLELGSGSVKALKLELKDDAPVVTDFIVVPHAKVLSTPGLDPDDAMRVALGTLATQKDLTGARVAVGVPGQASFARFAKLPPVEAKKVPDIVKFEAAQQIPFPLEDVEWDYQTFQSPDSPDIEVGIFAMTKERMKHQLDLLADVGISPDVVTLNPVATYNAMAYDLEFTEATTGTILLDIGTTSTDLTIAEAGRVWERTFPIGGHHFTEAVVQAFNLSYPKADRLKREAQQTKHAKHVFQAMRGMFGDLAQEVQRSIGYYQSLHPDANLKRVIGMGATFNLPGLRKFLKQQIQMDVYRLENFKRSKIGDQERVDEFEAKAGELVVCYGLALQGIGFETIDANLIPVEIVREAMWRQKTPLFVGAAGLALLSCGAMFVGPLRDNNKLGDLPVPREVADATAAVDEQKSAAQEAGVLGGGQADMTAANVVALTESPQVHAHIVHDVGEIFRDASEKLVAGGIVMEDGQAAKEPGFELVKLTTDFVAPGDSITSKLPTQREMEDDPNEDKPRVVVTLTARTPHPEPRVFVVETIDKWLLDNSVREGVPYFIVADERDLLVRIDDSQIAVVDTIDRSRRSSRQRLAGRDDPGFGSHDDVFGDDPGGRQAFLDAGGMITGTPVRGGRRGQAGTRDLDSNAPIVAPDDPRGERLREVEVFWYVVIGEPEEQSDGEDD